MVDSTVYQQYLQDLKSTVEGLLVTRVANVWSIFGGLNRLYLSLEKIFRHGCRKLTQEGQFFNFIQGLEWLQPSSTKSFFALDCEYRPHIPALLKNDKSCIWLYRSLESHTLSSKLSWLLSDDSHLQSCYDNWAFLCQKQYAEATLICLKAVEKNQATFLSEINPCLFLKNVNTGVFLKSHRRCSSFPDNHFGARSILKDTEKPRMVFGKLKPWASLPALQIDGSKIAKKVHFQSRTTPNTPVNTKKISPSFLKVDYKVLKRSSKFKKAIIINNSDIIEHTPPLSSSHDSGVIHEDSKDDEKKRGFFSQSPLSMMDSFLLTKEGEKDYSRHRPKSFIEDGGMSILPASTGQGYFPKPLKGQSLTSYLNTTKLSRSKAELDRENAHFSISEAIISAMEKLKCQYREFGKYLSDTDSEERDPVLLDNLKQRIRLRRGRRLVERRGRHWTGTLLRDEKTDTATTASPSSTPFDSLSDRSSSEDVDDIEIDEATNLGENQGLSMSMASLYSDADIIRRPRGAPDGASEVLVTSSDVLSAEGVALSLISKFNEKHLPKASDLEWLVSEKDVPQALLPLPKSWPVNPDDYEGCSTPIRGTRDWAPPRPQIVLTLLPSPSRKILMEKQNYKCAGCGMKVVPRYASKFRYCNYLGKYFCTACHKNQVSFIPARILYKWDFTRCPVSTFSFKLLEQMYNDPLFRIFELNKDMGKFKNVDFIRHYRKGLCYLKDYIFSCRLAETVQERLKRDLPSYFLEKPDEYSIDDLVNIRSGELKTKLKFLVDICLRHTTECKLCLARGYICEICNGDDVIFPWQMRIVTRCPKCLSCYHSKCWITKNECLKCKRKTKRKDEPGSSRS